MSNKPLTQLLKTEGNEFVVKLEEPINNNLKGFLLQGDIKGFKRNLRDFLKEFYNLEAINKIHLPKGPTYEKISCSAEVKGEKNDYRLIYNIDEGVVEIKGLIEKSNTATQESSQYH